jgi:cytochrome c oxidase assembly factor CtaG
MLTFAPDALYAFYANQPDYWGMSPTDDQAVAGLIMAMEQSVVMGIALVVLFARMINDSEKQEQRLERYGDTAVEEFEPEGPSQAALEAQARVRAQREAAARLAADEDAGRFA